jgi:hypothetical protein
MPRSGQIASEWIHRSTRLAVTARARGALARVCERAGPHALLLSWPGGATCLPVGVIEPDAFDVIIGHVAGCAIHADLRQLDFYRDRSAILDLARPKRPARPVMLLRRGLVDRAGR